VAPKKLIETDTTWLWSVITSKKLSLMGMEHNKLLTESFIEQMIAMFKGILDIMETTDELVSMGDVSCYVAISRMGDIIIRPVIQGTFTHVTIHNRRGWKKPTIHYRLLDITGQSVIKEVLFDHSGRIMRRGRLCEDRVTSAGLDQMMVFVQRSIDDCLGARLRRARHK
jgi:hypothetical protein